MMEKVPPRESVVELDKHKLKGLLYDHLNLRTNSPPPEITSTRVLSLRVLRSSRPRRRRPHDGRYFLLP